MFELGTSKIQIDGTEVVPFPLYQVLDGKTATDYLQRVEPSPSGGRKMAQALMRAVLDTEEPQGYFDDHQEQMEPPKHF